MDALLQPFIWNWPHELAGERHRPDHVNHVVGILRGVSRHAEHLLGERSGRIRQQVFRQIRRGMMIIQLRTGASSRDRPIGVTKTSLPTRSGEVAASSAPASHRTSGR